MRPLTKIVMFSLFITACLFTDFIYAQSVMQPTDITQTYNSRVLPLPAKPGMFYDNNIHPWYRGNLRLITNWADGGCSSCNPVRPPHPDAGTDSYKAYVYKSQTFRLKYPKTYNPTAVDGKRYPMLIFLHGNGETTWNSVNGFTIPNTGGIRVTDPTQYYYFENEYSLLWGGKLFRDYVDDGMFDGYVMFMQVQIYGWDIGQFNAIKEICDYMVINNKLDPFAIVDNGLSGGGLATWALMIEHPTLLAGALPMSGAAAPSINAVEQYKYTPIWIFQGGNDNAQAENTTFTLINDINAAGGRIQWAYYSNSGHNTWQPAFLEPQFLPFIKSCYAANPWPVGYQSDQPPPPNAPAVKPVGWRTYSLPVNIPVSFYFTGGSPINVLMGVAPGYSNYEWRVNGAIIPGANSNTFTANKPGKYETRITKNGVVSEWSRMPINIFLNGSLPVNWISFTGNLVSDGVELKWQVENNEQADYYQIEHSTDGVNFSKVDQLPNIKDVKSYTYKYKTKEAGNHYFRILQADFDRKYIFSKVIAVKLKGDANYTVRLMTNPVRTDFADLEISALKQGKAQVEIWSTTGAKIASKQQQVVVGVNRFQVPLNNVAPGMYMLKIQVGNAVVTEKLIKL